VAARIPFFALVLLARVAAPLVGADAVEASGERAAIGKLTSHAKSLEKRLTGRGFHVVVEAPFVVIGDESAATVRRRAKETVAWAVERLRRAYFPQDPARTIEIWLFKDTDSYETHAKEFFGKKPTTPYGYYSATHRALVMNISTGGGTLVHEIVHPFIEANFPRCPAWFNEGLASLYEQCRDRDGVIWGETNWRLEGLKKAIAAGRTPSFEELCGTSTDEFYADERGVHYAQARYLCYYLQERGLLADYYRQFSGASASDPTGYKTLRKILGSPNMDDFQKKWEAFVLKLEF
jgi:hypothetical protein